MDRRQFLYGSAFSKAALRRQDTGGAGDLPEARFQIEGGKYQFGSIEGAQLVLEVNGRQLFSAAHSDVSADIRKGQRILLELRFDEPGITWSILFAVAADGSAGTISSTVLNTKIGRAHV